MAKCAASDSAEPVKVKQGGCSGVCEYAAIRMFGAAKGTLV